MDIVQGYSGLWTAADPFTLPKRNLKCTGISDFKSIISSGLNVYSKLYDLNGLTKEQYEVDLAANVKVVSLSDDTGTIYFVPDKYITKVPRYKTFPYKRLMIGLDAGLCFEELDVETLLVDLEEKASGHLGLNVKGYVTRIPSDVIVDEVLHKQNETARMANLTFSDSSDILLAKKEEEISRLKQHVATLEQIIKDLQV